MGAIETVTFNGVKYRRYASSPYFTPGMADKRKGARYLHEDIWRAANGQVPAGHNIHHRDFDALNNDLTNLQCLAVGEHQAVHAEQRKASGWYWTPERLAHLESIRPLAAAWHSSPDGRAWHKQHGADSWADRPERELKCERCGATFTTRKAGEAKYCTSTCKMAARRARGDDQERRTCTQCASSFTCNRYSKSATCSKSCAYRSRT